MFCEYHAGTLNDQRHAPVERGIVYCMVGICEADGVTDVGGNKFRSHVYYTGQMQQNLSERSEKGRSHRRESQQKKSQRKKESERRGSTERTSKLREKVGKSRNIAFFQCVLDPVKV